MAARFLLLSLVAGLAAAQTGAPAENYLELYTQVEQVGASITITEYQHDLSVLGFDNLARSVCGQGVWILYAGVNYEAHRDGWDDVLAFSDYQCQNLPVTWQNEASSVRYAGTGDLDDETLTVYHGHSYSYGEIMFIREEPFFGDYNNEGSSLIITGESAWTVYSAPGYHGTGICVQPWPIGNGKFMGMWTVEDIGLENNEMSSLQKGCWSSKIIGKPN